jgi:hypothetical protein
MPSLYQKLYRVAYYSSDGRAFYLSEPLDWFTAFDRLAALMVALPGRRAKLIPLGQSHIRRPHNEKN